MTRTILDWGGLDWGLVVGRRALLGCTASVGRRRRKRRRGSGSFRRRREPRIERRFGNVGRWLLPALSDPGRPRLVSGPWSGNLIVGEVFGAAKEANGHGGAVPLRAVQRNRAAVQVEQVLREGESDAHAVPLTGRLLVSLLESPKDRRLPFLRSRSNKAAGIFNIPVGGPSNNVFVAASRTGFERPAVRR